jgi:hypothetical protein
MSISITLEGVDWAEIVSQARQIAGEGQYLDLRTPAEAPKPRATRTKATAPIVETQISREAAEAAGLGMPAVAVAVEHVTPEMLASTATPEPIFESTVTTPIVEEPVPSVDAPVETQASTSEAGSDEPASGSATTASEPITYEDMSREVLALAKEKGPDAVKAVLSTFGLTSARGTPAEMWPQIIAAVRSAM